MTENAKAKAAAARKRGTGTRIDGVDLHVSRRLRDRRLALGVSLKDLAQELGISYQQIQKYESGANRISSGRLYLFAKSLSVEISYFYEGVTTEGEIRPLPAQSPERQRFRLARDLKKLTNQKIQTAVIELVRVIATADESYEF